MSRLYRPGRAIGHTADSTRHNNEVIGTAADTTGNNAALAIPIARFTGAADESIGLFARFTARPEHLTATSAEPTGRMADSELEATPR